MKKSVILLILLAILAVGTTVTVSAYDVCPSCQAGSIYIDSYEYIYYYDTVPCIHDVPGMTDTRMVYFKSTNYECTNCNWSSEISDEYVRTTYVCQY